MKLVILPLRTSAILILAAGLFCTPVSASQISGQFDVVSPSWITGNRGAGVIFDSPGETNALVFPSLAADTNTAAGVHFTLHDFVRPNNRFQETRFEWAGAAAGEITLATDRHGQDVEVTIDGTSEARIRRLGWSDFQLLQIAFSKWLYHHSGCWFFEDCSRRFTGLFREDLVALWKDHVLADAGFREFSEKYLLQPAPGRVPFAGTALRIHYSGHIPGPQPDNTWMFVSRVLPGQRLVVTWGDEALYPGTGGVSGGYTRSTSSGQTSLQVIQDTGMRLFPRGTCTAISVWQQGTTSGNFSSPYPQEWKALLSGSSSDGIFVPIYNQFDLHNADLLTKVPPHGPEDGRADDYACAGYRQAPRFIFLLTPATYIKGDSADGTAQFENEASLAGPAPGDRLDLLAHQYVIMGCDTDDIAAIREEWNSLLESAYVLLAPGASVSPRRCAGYVQGLFSGKAFVELRHNYSLNGRPAGDSAPNLETVGQVIQAASAAKLDREGQPGSGALLDLVRSPPDDEGRPRASAIIIHFHTTAQRVLDQITILEGDAIDVR